MNDVSLPKKKGNPGTPLPKDPNVIFVRTSDIVKFPVIGDDDAEAVSDIELKPEAKAVAVYFTPDTIKIKDGTDGGNDEKGFNHEFEGSHPGKEPEFKRFVKNSINADYVMLVKDEVGVQLLGSVFNPMKMDAESQDDKDAVKTTVKAKSSMRGRNPIVYYKGKLPSVAPDHVDTPEVPTPPAGES